MKKPIIVLFVSLFTLHASLAQQGTIQLPATGQITSYYPGDDGDLQNGVHWPAQRFTDNGNGTCTDALTGLTWATEGNIMALRDPGFDQDYIPGDGSVNWTTALDYVAKLNSDNYLGHSDWRLPNIKEISSLIDLECGDTTISSNHLFTNLQQCYWSSTSGYDRGWAYCVTIFYWQIHSNSFWIPGEIDLMNKILPMDGYEDFRKMYVLPVRGNTASGLVELPRTFQYFDLYPGDDKSFSMGIEWPHARFIDNGDSTVTDRLTGLMWTQKAHLQSSFPDFAPPYNDFSWEIALDFIAMLNNIAYLGYNDWRLPNRNELLSIRNCGDQNLSLALQKYHPFIIDYSGSFSSSTVASDPGKFYLVSMSPLYSQYEFPKTELYYSANAWPVRDATSPLPQGGIEGNIMASSSPVAGVKMTLDGPIRSVIFSKEDGTYELTNIPAGQYTITLEKDYFEFNPNPGTQNVNNQTITQNFSANLNSNFGWTDLRGNMPESGVLQDVFAIGDHVWMVGSQDKVYYSPDGGETFHIHILPEGVGLTSSIFMKDENEGYLVTTGGYILHTSDAGNGNWSILYNTGKVLLSVTMPPTHERAFACGDGGAILSFDNDDFIDMSMPTLTEPLYSINFPVNAEEGWLCGYTTIRHFLNNTWNNLQIHEGGLKSSIFFADNTTGYVALHTDWGTGRIVKTVDGITYNPNFDSDVVSGFMDVFFLSPEEGWTLGYDAIFHTSDAGENWGQQAPLTSYDKALIAVCFTSPGSGYAVGNDQFLKFGPLSTGTDIDGPASFITLDFKVCPNPTHGKFQITSTKFQKNSKSQNSISKLEVVDLYGKVLLEEVKRGRGEEVMMVDVSNLPPGVYFVRISIDNQIVVKKIIKL